MAIVISIAFFLIRPFFFSITMPSWVDGLMVTCLMDDIDYLLSTFAGSPTGPTSEHEVRASSTPQHPASLQVTGCSQPQTLLSSSPLDIGSSNCPRVLPKLYPNTAKLKARVSFEFPCALDPGLERVSPSI